MRRLWTVSMSPYGFHRWDAADVGHARQALDSNCLFSCELPHVLGNVVWAHQKNNFHRRRSPLQTISFTKCDSHSPRVQSPILNMITHFLVHVFLGLGCPCCLTMVRGFIPLSSRRPMECRIICGICSICSTLGRFRGWTWQAQEMSGQEMSLDAGPQAFPLSHGGTLKTAWFISWKIMWKWLNMDEKWRYTYFRKPADVKSLS